MLTSSLQSTWEAQRNRQRPKYGASSYQNNYNVEDSENKKNNLPLAGNSTYNNSISGYANKNIHQEATNYPELPNLKVPQVNNISLIRKKLFCHLYN